MTLENPGLSRRKLLRTTAIGVPAAGLLAFVHPCDRTERAGLSRASWC